MKSRVSAVDGNGRIVRKSAPSAFGQLYDLHSIVYSAGFGDLNVLLNLLIWKHGGVTGLCYDLSLGTRREGRVLTAPGGVHEK